MNDNKKAKLEGTILTIFFYSLGFIAIIGTLLKVDLSPSFNSSTHELFNYTKLILIGALIIFAIIIRNQDKKYSGNAFYAITILSLDNITNYLILKYYSHNERLVTCLIASIVYIIIFIVIKLIYFTKKDQISSAK